MRSSTRTRVALLVSACVAGAGAALTLAAAGIGTALSEQSGATLAFLSVSVALQLLALRIPARGSLSVSAVGIIAAAISLGTGPAMAIGVLVALAHWARTRAPGHRALFDASNLALAAGAAGLTFQALTGPGSSGLVTLLAALAAGLAYCLVNVGLLCLAMGASELRSPLAIWQQRLHWARYHFLAFGALALLCSTAYAQLGAASLIAFVLPPLLLTLSLRSGLARLSPKTA
jgi:hypothetical protein